MLFLKTKVIICLFLCQYNQHTTKVLLDIFLLFSFFFYQSGFSHRGCRHKIIRSPPCWLVKALTCCRKLILQVTMLTMAADNSGDGR